MIKEQDLNGEKTHGPLNLIFEIVAVQLLRGHLKDLALKQYFNLSS